MLDWVELARLRVGGGRGGGVAAPGVAAKDAALLFWLRWRAWAGW